MYLRYVEMFSDFEVDANLFIFMEHFQALLKHIESLGGLHLQLREVDEVKKGLDYCNGMAGEYTDYNSK